MSAYPSSTLRERVFFASLQYHGFRLTRRRKNLKFKRGYIIPATRFEDAGGVDAWIKMPRDARLTPIQVTQRGVKHYKKFSKPTDEQLQDFISKSNHRISAKQRRSKRHHIAFVLVRDHIGHRTNPTIAWGDIKTLRYGIAALS